MGKNLPKLHLKDKTQFYSVQQFCLRDVFSHQSGPLLMIQLRSSQPRSSYLNQCNHPVESRGAMQVEVVRGGRPLAAQRALTHDCWQRGHLLVCPILLLSPSSFEHPHMYQFLSPSSSGFTTQHCHLILTHDRWHLLVPPTDKVPSYYQHHLCPDHLTSAINFGPSEYGQL